MTMVQEARFFATVQVGESWADFSARVAVAQPRPVEEVRAAFIQSRALDAAIEAAREAGVDVDNAVGVGTTAVFEYGRPA